MIQYQVDIDKTNKLQSTTLQALKRYSKVWTRKRYSI